jgi:hypothetical protein
MPMWRLALWRFSDVAIILNQLPLKHPEKVAKARIALKLGMGAKPQDRKAVISEWESLRFQIAKDVADYIEKARGILGSSSPAP